MRSPDEWQRVPRLLREKEVGGISNEVAGWDIGTLRDGRLNYKSI